MAGIAAWKTSSIIVPTIFTSSATVATDITLNPEGWKAGSIASYVDRSGGQPLGYKRSTFHLRPPTKESRVYKLSVKFFHPILETIDPAVGIFGPRLAYELQAHMDFLMPERATLAERTAFLSYVRGLLCNQIAASDSAPSDAAGSPIDAAVLLLEDVY